MLAAIFFFSLMQVCVKAVPHIPAYEIVFFRAIVAFMICLVMIRQKRISPFGRLKKLLILRGLFGTAALLSFFYTLQNMPLASAVTLHQLTPMFTILLAGLIVGEHTDKRQWGFFIAAFLGVYLIQGFDPRISVGGTTIAILAALFSAAAYNIIRKIGDREHHLVIILYFPFVTLTLIGPYTIWNWIAPQGLDWLFLTLVGVFTQTAHIFMTKAYQMEKASNIAGYNYLGVVFALVFGYVLFGEVMNMQTLAGLVLVVSSVVLASQFRSKAS